MRSYSHGDSSTLATSLREGRGQRAGSELYTCVEQGTRRDGDWPNCPAVEREPGRVRGAGVFRGTRIPVAALFEILEDDASAHQFVEWFPGVSIEQVRAVLEHAARSSLAVA